MDEEALLNRLKFAFLGVGGAGCGYDTLASSNEKVLKLEEEEDARVESIGSGLDDEVSRIRSEFDAAKRSFLKIPEALKDMPKMNPKGL